MLIIRHFKTQLMGGATSAAPGCRKPVPSLGAWLRMLVCHIGNNLVAISTSTCPTNKGWDRCTNAAPAPEAGPLGGPESNELCRLHRRAPASALLLLLNVSTRPFRAKDTRNMPSTGGCTRVGRRTTEEYYSLLAALRHSTMHFRHF